MSRIFHTMLFFLLGIQAACADEAKWGEPKWPCPSSITVEGISYEFNPISMFDGAPEHLHLH